MPESQPRNLRVVREISRPDILLAVARVPQSDRLMVASSAGKVVELSAAQGGPAPRDLADHGRYVTSVRLTDDMVISGGYDGRLIWWDLEDGGVIRTVAGHRRWIRQIAVSPDGCKVASVADDMVCRVWNTRSGRLMHELRGHAEQTPQHF